MRFNTHTGTPTQESVTFNIQCLAGSVRQVHRLHHHRYSIVVQLKPTEIVIVGKTTHYQHGQTRLSIPQGHDDVQIRVDVDAVTTSSECTP